jgi:hypothetical protein
MLRLIHALRNAKIRKRYRLLHWGGTKEMPTIFLRNYNYIYDEIYIYHEYTFYKLRLFFHKISFIINTIFPLLHETLYAGLIKLCWSVLALQSRCVSARRRPQNGIVRVHPSEG